MKLYLNIHLVSSTTKNENSLVLMQIFGLNLQENYKIKGNLTQKIHSENYQ